VREVKVGGRLSGESPAECQEPEHFPEPRSFAAREVTGRQLECLSWVAAGKSSTDIGEILGISSRTVEDHLSKLCGHLGVRTRVQAAVRAQELGWINPPTP